ncbi:MAG TPA: Ig-like domain repeat protein [Bryobacteraceae bacterium]
MSFRTIQLALLLTCVLRAQSDAGRTLNPAAATPQSPPFTVCPAGSPVGAIDLQVEAGGQQLPFDSIIHLSEDDTLHYSPILRGKEKRPGEVAFVLIPEKRTPGQPDILVTDTKSADKPQEWKIKQTISLAALVYGPSGLNRKKVANFLARDEVLVAQLADYADKTAQAEQLVATLSNSESSSATVNAALTGFASQYGFAVQIDRSAPIQAQAETVFATMNPQLSAYSPTTSSTPQRVGQTASLATMAGALFFGSPIGLAAGGTAMLLDLRSIAFPDTQFRPAFAQVLPAPAPAKTPSASPTTPPASAASGSPGSAVNLCGQQGPLPPHTRVAYIWASRIPNIPPPVVQIGKAAFIPAGQKTAIPVDAPDPGWKYLDRARQWVLAADQKSIPITVTKLGNQHSLELDLTKAALPPGDYTLNAVWDWAPFSIKGAVHVRGLSTFEKAHLDPASQDGLLARSGKIPVTVEGSDFEFTTKVEVEKQNDEFATPQTVRFILPKGLREGPQERMDVQIDTQALDPGPYKLLISQQDGKAHTISFQVLPNPPRIDNLPIVVNQGSAVQHFVLKGERLDQLKELKAAGAVLNLSSPEPNQTQRSVTVELKSSPAPRTSIPLKAYLVNRSEPLLLSGALEVTGPLPVIASSKLSLPKGIAITVRTDEFPAGYTLNAMLDVKNIERQSVLRLSCTDGVGDNAVLHIGEQAATWNLQQLSPDQLFLAFDTSSLPAGCMLQGILDNGRGGASQPFPLAHILRLPHIDSLTIADPASPPSARQYQLTGQNLEMIDKVGWNSSAGLAISGLPTPLPGPGLKQSLQFNLPDPPSPGARLYIWMRGDQQGRESSIQAPPPPPPAQTSIVLTASPNPAPGGQAVTFTATVAPPEATGTVVFKQADVNLGSSTLQSGQATLTISTLPAGDLQITASYQGDPRFAPSTSPSFAQTIVQPAATAH